MGSVFVWFMFFPVLLLGMVFSLSGGNWLFVWAGLELSVLAFLPLMLSSELYSEVEASVKYFLVQAFSSMVLLVAFLGLMIMNFDSMSFLSSLFFMSMVMKMGMAPFHFWIPQVMEGLNWPACLVLATAQKIIPLSVCVNVVLCVSYSLEMLVILMSGLVGGWGGVGQSRLRPMFAYGSVNHMAWIMAACATACKGAMLYFMVYVALAFGVMLICWYMGLSSVSQFASKASSWAVIAVFWFIFMSFMGFPMTSGFTVKFIVLMELVVAGDLIIAVVLVVSSVISLCYYFVIRVV